MHEEQVYSVSDLNDTISSVLLNNFPQSIYVQGEISNFKSATSGHWYFSLKDETCQIKAVMFKVSNRLIQVPKDGDKVLICADINFYKGRGECQIICKTITPQGIGSLLAKLEALKHKLATEGLFDSERKKNMPMYPKRIGIVTSAQAAALQDMLKIFKESRVFVEIYLFPCKVQGDQSSEDIVEKLTHAYNFKVTTHTLDLIIVSRGGGASEDLLSFSDELLVRKIVESPVPIITGIGHEVDISLADLAADIHQPTPTAAAKVVCEHILKLYEYISHIHQSMSTDFQYKFDTISHSLVQFSPSSFYKMIIRNLINQKQTLDKISEALQIQIIQSIANLKQKLIYMNNQFESISPLKVLEKGYALLKDADTNKVIKNHASTFVNQNLKIRFIDGEVSAKVKERDIS